MRSLRPAKPVRTPEDIQSSKREIIVVHFLIGGFVIAWFVYMLIDYVTKKWDEVSDEIKNQK